MIGSRGMIFSAVAMAVLSMGLQSAHAAPIINIINDAGDRNTFGPSVSTGDSTFAPIYGSASVMVTPITNPSNVPIGFKLTFAPNQSFSASANNLSGGMTQTLDANLTFNIDFGSPVNLTTNINEGGTYGVSGNGIATAGQFTAAGVTVTEIDDGSGVDNTNSFATHGIASYDNVNGKWSLFDQLPAAGGAHAKYRVVIDNDLFAEAATSNSPGFASIAKKSFSINFTFDGSTGGNPPPTPEPASLGVLALGSLALLARRRK